MEFKLLSNVFWNVKSFWNVKTFDVGKHIHMSTAKAPAAPSSQICEKVHNC